MATPTPSKVSGGCLCGAVRYEVNFKPDHDFKTNASVCFCTQCRKQSGALAIHFHTIPLSSFHWLSSAPSLAAYQILPGNQRWFCKTCGSFLAWQGGEKTKDGEGVIEVAAGTVDEEFLVGRKDEKGEVVEGSGFGEVLCRGRVGWAQNEVRGVTEGIRGERYKFGTAAGIMS